MSGLSRQVVRGGREEVRVMAYAGSRGKRERACHVTGIWDLSVASEGAGV